jgi:hypothetical protein
MACAHALKFDRDVHIHESSQIMDQAITITYGDQAENHAGMQIIGDAQSAGLSDEDMIAINKFLTDLEMKTEIVQLNGSADLPSAQVLIIRNGVDAILGPLGRTANDMYAEHIGLPKDTKAFMYGRVVNKKARHNLCFADAAQEPDYEAGRGRIIPWDSIPLTNKIRQFMALAHPKFRSLVAEGNYYYDPSKCGISFHGDTERRIVIAARLGVPIPLHYQWFLKHNPIGPRIKLALGHGDIYIMSNKAVGYDWKTSKGPTLRHAAGAPAFLV